MDGREITLAGLITSLKDIVRFILLNYNETTMAKQRKQGNDFTTISIPWDIKENLRMYASPTKTTKVGQNWETDLQIIKKMIEFYGVNHSVSNPDMRNTYPKRPKI